MMKKKRIIAAAVTVLFSILSMSATLPATDKLNAEIKSERRDKAKKILKRNGIIEKLKARKKEKQKIKIKDTCFEEITEETLSSLTHETFEFDFDLEQQQGIENMWNYEWV